MSAPRELTVGQLLEQLRGYPEHYHVSPIVDGTAGAGLAVWCQHMPDVGEPVVLFGEQPVGVPPVVPAEWVAGR